MDLIYDGEHYDARLEATRLVLLRALMTQHGKRQHSEGTGRNNESTDVTT